MDMNSTNVMGERLEQGELSGAGEAAGDGSFGIMDVLFPARPPEPKNPRVIRRFDLEAAKNDPRPGEPAAPAPAPKVNPAERLSREEAKALRNRSLLAAAGLA